MSVKNIELKKGPRENLYKGQTITLLREQKRIQHIEQERKKKEKQRGSSRKINIFKRAEKKKIASYVFKENLLIFEKEGEKRGKYA